MTKKNHLALSTTIISTTNAFFDLQHHTVKRRHEKKSINSLFLFLISLGAVIVNNLQLWRTPIYSPGVSRKKKITIIRGLVSRHILSFDCVASIGSTCYFVTLQLQKLLWRSVNEIEFLHFNKSLMNSGMSSSDIKVVRLTRNVAKGFYYYYFEFHFDVCSNDHF